MALDPVTAVLNVGQTLIEKFFPDPAQRDAAKLQLLTMQQNGELQEVANVYSDMASARNLAAADIAKGNAFTGALAAVVRPLWGIGSFVLVTHYVVSHVPIDTGVADIIKTVIWFYFGGRVVEKVTPHIAGAISK